MQYLTIVSVLGLAAAGLAAVALIKKPWSVYRDKPGEMNPMEGKRVVFVENPSEKANADGVCGHLEAVGVAPDRRGIYDRYVKRAIDVVLSFCGLVLLSPVFLILRTRRV